MKKEEKRRCLGVITVQSFTTVLDREERWAIKGGSLETQGRTTVPIFCRA